MTRKDKLIAMSGVLLIGVADKLGVKVACNKSRTALKEAKLNVVERILAAEAAIEPAEEPVEAPVEDVEEVKEITEESAEEPVEEPETVEVTEAAPAEKKIAKRGALIEYNGKSQNICAWAKELGVSANTLYGRIYKLGWSVEKAFTK